MAKGNMLLGKARGKCGSLVYSVVNGQQVTRPLNDSPRNPQTSAQMYQRALFSDTVKFFTRGRRELFNFAFEDKKSNESNYNAFMRNNAKRGVLISKAAFEEYNYPALGNFMMSKGTLQPVKDSMSITGTSFISMTKEVVTELTAVTNVGQLASLLVNGVDYLADDIITFVMIKSGYPTIDNIPSVTPELSPGMETVWNIYQVNLTMGSTQPLSDFGISASLSEAIEGVKTLTIRTIDNSAFDAICAGCVIHSRNTKTGIRVSTQELKLNTPAETAIEAARQRSYTDAVVESWRTTQQAPVVSETIMQGSIAQSIALDFEPGE